MTDERHLVDSDNFEAMAYGIFETAPNYAVGRDALVEAYNKYDWTDKEKANDTLEYYGQALKNRDGNQSHFGESLETIAPVTMQDVVNNIPPGQDQDPYAKWEELNLEYLNREDLPPEYRVAKQQFISNIKDYAQYKRRQGRFDNSGALGEAVDISSRFARGALAGVSGAIKTVDGDIDLDSYFTEFTNPENDGSFLHELAGVAGNVGGFLVAGAGAGRLGTYGMAIGQGTGAVRERYEESKEATGDISAARTAAAIETGSQVLQVFGEKAVFGRAADILKGKVPAGELGKELVHGAFTEAVSEGAGQVISNVAENVGTNAPAFTDVNRGVGMATALGAIGGAAGAGVAVHDAGKFSKKEQEKSTKVPGPRNTDAREKELLNEGTIETPVTKQVVGDVSPGEVDDVFVGDDPEGTSLAPKKVRLAEGTPLFVTEDGTEYVQTSDGRVAKKGGLPLDNVVYASSDNVGIIASALLNGEQVVPTDTGISIQKVDANGKVVDEDLDLQTDYTKDVYPIEISYQKNPNSLEVTRHISVGKRIRTVLADRSMGAAGMAEVTQKETTYGARLSTMTEVPALQAIGQEGIYYDPVTKAFKKLVGESIVGYANKDNKLDKVVQDLKEGKIDPLNVGPVAAALDDLYSSEIIKATAEGDYEKADALGQEFRPIAQVIGPSLSKVGQALAVIPKMRGRENVQVLNEIRQDAYTQAVTEQTVDTDYTPEEIESSDKDYVEAVKDIEKVQSVIDKEPATVAAPITEEEVALSDVVTDIESQAQERVDEDQELIERETSDLNNSIETITKKAERRKRKDIRNVEKQLATDSEELVKAIADGQNLQKVSAEEQVKLEEDINKNFKEAEALTNQDVKEAVKADRDARQNANDARIQRAETNLRNEQLRYDQVKQAIQKELADQDIRRRNQIAQNKPTTAVDKKIASIEQKEAKLLKKIADAKIELARVKEEIDREAQSPEEIENEKLLQELEGGVTVQFEPVGKKRAIVTRAKKTGRILPINKLFGKNSHSLSALSALSNGVNRLAGLIQQTAKTKNINNERIVALNDRIKNARKTLDSARSADALDKADRQKIEAARKRLEELGRAKSEATVENYIPRNKKEKYTKYKARLNELKTNRPGGKDNPKVSEARKKLAELERKRKRAEVAKEKKKQARKKADEVSTVAAKVLQEVTRLQGLLNNPDLTDHERVAIEAKINALKGVFEKDPVVRSAAMAFWSQNLIGQPGSIMVGQATGLLQPAIGTLEFSIPTLKALAKNLRFGKKEAYKYPLLEFLKGYADSDAFKIGKRLARISWKEGLRIKSPYTREQTGPVIPLTAHGKEEILTAADRFYKDSADFINYAKNLKWEKFDSSFNALKNLQTFAIKAAGYTSAPLVRAMVSLEAFNVAFHDSAYDRATAAIYFNKALDEEVTPEELAKYKYNPKENWGAAQKVAAIEAQKLRDSGVDISESREFINAVEKYITMRPREVGITVWKRANAIGLNVQAQGYIGAAAGILETSLQGLENTKNPLRVLKYIVPFVNSVAVMMNRSVELTPFGLVGLYGNKYTNRTYAEQEIMKSAAISGTAMMLALAAKAVANMDYPEDERPFEIIGRYSSDKEKQAVYLNSGGLINSIKVNIAGKKVYIPFSETPLALMFGAIGSYTDRLRDKKDTSPETTGDLMGAAFELMVGTLGPIKSISMLRGVSDISEYINDIGNGVEGADVKLARSLFGTAKGFITASGVLRTVARYTDNPVDAKHDMLSALVEGIPGLQSMFGEPALNIFGEVLTRNAGVHRIFSLETNDLDIRWLTQNKYDVPLLNNMRMSSDIQEMLSEGVPEDEVAKLDYNLKRKVYQSAAPDLRTLVSNYRRTYGASARSEEVQKDLRSQWNRVLAEHAANVLLRNKK